MSFGGLRIVVIKGLVLHQIVSGKARNSNWQVQSTRRAQPGKYWFSVLLQSAIVGSVLGLLIYSYSRNQ
jgi:hypothetical protein